MDVAVGNQTSNARKLLFPKPLLRESCLGICSAQLQHPFLQSLGLCQALFITCKIGSGAKSNTHRVDCQIFCCSIWLVILFTTDLRCCIFKWPSRMTQRKGEQKLNQLCSDLRMTTTRARARMHTHTLTHTTHIHMHVHMHAHAHTRTHKHTRMHAHTYACTHAYTSHTHTHMYA